MDPFVEACGLWEGFHFRLILKIDEALSRVLPSRYTTDVAARSYIVMVEAEAKKLFEIERFRENFVEIYLQNEDRTLVTSIELLSPANKRLGTEGYNEYLRKRQAMLLGQANFVELDLLRGGEPLPMRTEWPDAPYRLLVCWAKDAPHCRAWPAHFNERLPTILVPLLEPDAEISLDLQPLVDEIYALGRYHNLIDYQRSLKPQLSKSETAWVRERLRSHRSKESH
jgi:hypothetical protein